jgi:hypothetical protein
MMGVTVALEKILLDLICYLLQTTTLKSRIITQSLAQVLYGSCAWRVRASGLVLGNTEDQNLMFPVQEVSQTGQPVTLLVAPELNHRKSL